MKGSPFHRPTRLELIYQREIQALVDKYLAVPTFQTLGELNSRMVEWGQMQSFFQKVSLRLASDMITMVRVSNARSWREAATKASKGRYIYSMLKSELKGDLGTRLDTLIQSNAAYISTLPESIAKRTTAFVQREQMKGRRSTDIMQDIQPYMQHLKRFEVQRIARTEVAKADTAITRVRAQSIGLNWYQWETSKDARVRPSHKKMQGVLVCWDDPPSPELLARETSVGRYHAGEIYNCRCPALPITSLADIRWPARVYRNGSLKMLTRSQFMLVSGIPLQLVA